MRWDDSWPPPLRWRIVNIWNSSIRLQHTLVRHCYNCQLMQLNSILLLLLYLKQSRHFLWFLICMHACSLTYFTRVTSNAFLSLVLLFLPHMNPLLNEPLNPIASYHLLSMGGSRGWGGGGRFRELYKQKLYHEHYDIEHD